MDKNHTISLDCQAYSPVTSYIYLNTYKNGLEISCHQNAKSVRAIDTQMGSFCSQKSRNYYRRNFHRPDAPVFTKKSREVWYFSFFFGWDSPPGAGPWREIYFSSPWTDLNETWWVNVASHPNEKYGSSLIKGQGHRGQRSNCCISEADHYFSGPWWDLGEFWWVNARLFPNRNYRSTLAQCQGHRG